MLALLISVELFLFLKPPAVDSLGQYLPLTFNPCVLPSVLLECSWSLTKPARSGRAVFILKICQPLKFCSNYKTLDCGADGYCTVRQSWNNDKVSLVYHHTSCPGQRQQPEELLYLTMVLLQGPFIFHQYQGLQFCPYHRISLSSHEVNLLLSA